MAKLSILFLMVAPTREIGQMENQTEKVNVLIFLMKSISEIGFMVKDMAKVHKLTPMAVFTRESG